MRLLLPLATLLTPALAWAVPCTLTWSHPTPETVDGYKLYRHATAADLEQGTLVAQLPQDQLQWDGQCTAGEVYTVTAVKAGKIESPHSLPHTIQQAEPPGELTVIFQWKVTMPQGAVR